MLNADYISEVIRLEYLQSLQQNHGKSIENLQKEEDIMITFSDLNVWFFNKDSHMFIDNVKNIFDSLEQNKLGKAKLRDFMSEYTKKLMDSVQLLLNQQAKIQTFQKVIANTQIIEQYFQQKFFSTSEILTACTETMIDINNLKEIKDISNQSIYQSKSTIKQQTKSSNKIKIQLNLKEIINIDLTPSFSKQNLEGYQLEIGDQKGVKCSNVQSLEGASISMRDEQINITMRHRCQTLLINLYEVLSEERNLVTQVAIDPFTLLYPSSFNTFQSINCPNIQRKQSLVHTIPLQCLQTGKEVYCNLILSAQIINENSNSEFSEACISESLIYDSQEQFISIFNKRVYYMNEKLNYGIEKYEKMINNFKLFIKPFQTIKLDDSYLKY